MKKMKLISIQFILLLISVSNYAQDIKQEEKIDEFQTPASPAFVLLGIEPVSISKPTTPRAVALNLISAIQQGGSFEVAPYWLQSHKDLTFNQCMLPSFSQTVLQTLSISLATIPKNGSNDTLGTRTGIGLRFMLFTGKPNVDNLKIMTDSLKKMQNEILVTENEERKTELEKEIQDCALIIQRESNIRLGFSLSFASAISINFIGDNLSKGKIDKWGTWLTASYLLDNPSVNVLAVTRVLGNIKTEGTQNVFDIGGRIVSSTGGLSVSCEYIQRIELSKSRTSNLLSDNFFQNNTYRLTGNIEYKYNNDISVYLTFGKNYSNEKSDNGNLVAQVGINYGLGKIPLLKYQ
jgi:hypothetical protein